MAKSREPLRLDVRKTYTLFIDGAFVRSESGASESVGIGSDEPATVARASRKDMRDAVAAARVAHGRWSALAPSARGLALYRLAELVAARRREFVDRLRCGANADASDARREVDAAIDRIFWYAGWCDKYATLLSAREPVAGPFVVTTAPRSVGVVGILAPDAPSLLGLISVVVPALVSGNTVVVVASETDPRTAIVFAECLATCELPPGCANVLTGRRIEIAPHLARHRDLDAFHACGLDGPFAAELERLAADDGKQATFVDASSLAGALAPQAQDLADIARFVRFTTIWHPAAK